MCRAIKLSIVCVFCDQLPGQGKKYHQVGAELGGSELRLSLCRACRGHCGVRRVVLGPVELCSRGDFGCLCCQGSWGKPVR
uniref:Uncharacterized protein n=1 Tax=Pan troglodytes TaxID=9598 RepID=G2HJ02_PANTR|nr:hypothetical protein [Pan troglodytes]